MSDRKDMNLTPEDQKLQDALRNLGEVQPDEIAQMRLRRAFMSGDIAQEAEGDSTGEAVRKVIPTGKKRTWFRLAAAILPLLVIVLLFTLKGGEASWTLMSVTGTGLIQVDGVSVEAGNTDALAPLVKPGVRMVVPDSVELELVLGEIMILGIISDSDVTIPSLQKENEADYTATVFHGELLVKTGPDFPGKQFLILTSEGRIELTGTIIAVNKAPEFTCVCVLEGTAQIGKNVDDLEAVPAGKRKVMFADGSPSIIVDIEPEHQKDLLEFQDRNEHIFEPDGE